MRVIITGGTGLIGRALAEDLVKDKNEVIVLSRDPEKSRDRLPTDASLVKWDGSTPDGWGSLVDGSTAIVNLAGDNLSSSRWTPEKKHLILNSRVKAGQAVNHAIEQAHLKPDVVVQASAVGIYGPHDDDIVTENTPLGMDFLAKLCVSWEASTYPVERMGVRRVFLRTGVVLSQEEGALPRMAMPYKFFVGGPIGNGKQWFPWIHIADEVAAIRFLIDRTSATGPYNLSAPAPVTNEDFSHLLGRVLGRPSFFPVPAFMLKLIFGEMSVILLKGQREVPQRLLESGFNFRFPLAEEALRDIYRRG